MGLMCYDSQAGGSTVTTILWSLSSSSEPKRVASNLWNHRFRGTRRNPKEPPHWKPHICFPLPEPSMQHSICLDAPNIEARGLRFDVVKNTNYSHRCWGNVHWCALCALCTHCIRVSTDFAKWASGTSATSWWWSRPRRVPVAGSRCQPAMLMVNNGWKWSAMLVNLCC